MNSDLQQPYDAGRIHVDAQAIKLPSASLGDLSDITLSTVSQYEEMVGWPLIEALFADSYDGALKIAGVIGGVISLIRHCIEIGESPVVISGYHTYAVPTPSGWEIYATSYSQVAVLKLTGDSTLSPGSRVYTRVEPGLDGPIYISSLTAIIDPPFWTRHVKTYETV